ncbi:MAG: response regulator transcription factor [Defluviitaleaceae bacterium]|nr:response regulator transcription factor [Defluviitaleaceae bacterium]
MNYNILICDDDADILGALEIYLRQEGYGVIKANDGKEAIALFREHGCRTPAGSADIIQNQFSSNTPRKENIHLILLDIMMPNVDGLQAAVKIREFSNVPIIFLSAKSEDTDRILGLNMGGDDYITKPFNPVELLARVKAALRRYARLGGMAVTAPQTGIYQTGGLVLDDNKKLVQVEGEAVNLTALEYNILCLLMSNMDRVFTSDQIYEAIWNEPAFHVSKTVSVHIRHIREKIEITPKEPRYLKVIYGLGYKVVKLA